MKKIIIPGLFSGLIILLVNIVSGWAVNLLFPSLQKEYENTSLFRAGNDPLMGLFFIHPFIYGLLLAWVWYKTGALFQKQNLAASAIRFAFVFWLVTTVPGMIISYASFPLSLLMIASWLFSTFAQLFFAGLVYAKMVPVSIKGPRGDGL